jgi:DNA-binding NarL/FixJ family response regulator
VRPRVAGLTAREFEVSSLVAQGLTNPQIAARLEISSKHAENCVGAAKKKAGAADRAQLAEWARTNCSQVSA